MATVRLGCWAAFWGDTASAARQLLREDTLDYLVADYLSEITMALLARAAADDPEAGYVPDVVPVLSELLPDIHERGIKVVTNAGALNPAACARALRSNADAAGIPVKVAAVTGDNLSSWAAELRAAGAVDMFTGEPMPAKTQSVNAYLGARPIAAALDAGADIVVTGRCADAAVVLGPLLHEFGWRDDAYDLLAAGTLAGHIVECGPQCTGGNHTDWMSVPGWADMGYPIAEVTSDGIVTITKPAETGGMVTPATVAEQMLYEIADPGAYVTPDVVCDWRQVRLSQDGADRVRIDGARGRPPTTTYKATCTSVDGHRVLTSAMFAGIQAGGRARRAAEAAVERAQRINTQAGREPFTEVSIEVVGAGDFTLVGEGPGADAPEAVVKVGLRHADKAALETFSREFSSIALVAPGMTGLFSGRPRVAPVIRLTHVLVDKSEVPASYDMGGDAVGVDVAAGCDYGDDLSTPTSDGSARGGDTNQQVQMPLHRLAYARSGDKGNNANIGVIARTPELFDTLKTELTADRVASLFARYLTGPVRRWEVPGVSALNFSLEGALGGAGGTSTLRFDPQGKSYAAMLLATPIDVEPALIPGLGNTAP
jgi:hypothetical protein